MAMTSNENSDDTAVELSTLLKADSWLKVMNARPKFREQMGMTIELVEEMRDRLAAVHDLADSWENAKELSTGRESVVAQAFASELRKALGE